MDDVEEAMIALEDIAGEPHPSGWIVDPSDELYFVLKLDPTPGKVLQGPSWASYENRLTVPRGPTKIGSPGELLHFKFLRRYAELRDAPNPADRGRKKRTP